jgi:polyisoprenoid-binding protein YceI
MTAVKLPYSLLSRSLFLTVTLVAAAASAGWSQQGEGNASFLSRGPAGLKIVGSTRSVEVKDDGKELTVAVKVIDLDTDNSLRNRHMLEDIEAAKFPLATLTVPTATVKEGADVEAKGTFTLHGKTREAPFRYTLKCNGALCDVEGSLELSLKDFEIKVRSYLGITVKDEVSVAIKFQLKK